jgi:hypothetical protein
VFECGLDNTFDSAINSVTLILVVDLSLFLLDFFYLLVYDLFVTLADLLHFMLSLDLVNFLAYFICYKLLSLVQLLLLFMLMLFNQSRTVGDGHTFLIA